MSPFDLNELPVSKAKKLTKAYRDLKGLKLSPFHFLPMKLFERLSEIPRIDGFKIYMGIDKGTDKEVLVLMPARVINKDTPDEEWEDIYSYQASINSGPLENININPIVALGPCPPPPIKTKNTIMNSDV